ncbi:MAG: tetratricopeptide repeat protein [Deltaproteobacteria bacterium]|nr:tetratricopeptide repeat protein [Deltaproteobacteria bacterium]
MNRFTRLAVLGAAVVLAGCPAKPKSETNEPSADEQADLSTYDPMTPSTGDLTDAEKAAKQEAAKKVMDKVKDRDPEEEKKKLARSRAISTQARDKLRKGQMKQAVSTARQALKVHEQNVDAMLVIAEVYQKEGKYELVRAVTSSALQVDIKIRTPEDSSRAYNLQGFAMLAMGEPTPATQSFKKAAEVDDKNASAWNNLGTRYLEAGDVGTATACFSYAIDLDPKFFKAQLNYGAALRASSKWEEAETTFRLALKLRPNYPEAYFNLGVLYLDADPFPGLDTTQRLNKAIQNLNKYRELAKGDPAARPGARSKGPGIGGSGKAPPPRVSKARADDFIRVANKGLEREARRIEREKERGAAGAEQPEGGDPTAAGAAAANSGDPAAGGTTADAPSAKDAPSTKKAGGPEGGDTTEPTKPTTQGPGKSTPAKPTTQGPGKPTPAKPTPAKPTTQGPGKPTPAKPTTQAPGKPTPSKPTPTNPTTQGPGKPAPTKPAPTKPTTQGPGKPTPTKPAPAPAKPAPTPTKPAPTPTKPAPTTPKPVKPTPVKPTPVKPTPVKPTPVKPGVQKPKSAAFEGPRPAPKKFAFYSGSRGTRSIPPTLNSMEAGAAARFTRVDLAVGSRSTGVVLDSSPAHDEFMVFGHSLIVVSTNEVSSHPRPFKGYA